MPKPEPSQRQRLKARAGLGDDDFARAAAEPETIEERYTFHGDEAASGGSLQPDRVLACLRMSESRRPLPAGWRFSRDDANGR